MEEIVKALNILFERAPNATLEVQHLIWVDFTILVISTKDEQELFFTFENIADVVRVDCIVLRQDWWWAHYWRDL